MTIFLLHLVATPLHQFPSTNTTISIPCYADDTYVYITSEAFSLWQKSNSVDTCHLNLNCCSSVLIGLHHKLIHHELLVVIFSLLPSFNVLDTNFQVKQKSGRLSCPPQMSILFSLLFRLCFYDLLLGPGPVVQRSIH